MGVYIIAEAGVNHNGDINLALDLVKKAKAVGADCVKFQTFKADKIVTANSPKAAYQLLTTDESESQYAMLKKLELGFEDYQLIQRKCQELEIDFLSTPYNLEDIDFLEKLGVTKYKVASGQLTETPFLEYLSKTKKELILSTGMAHMSEVFEAVATIRANGNDQITLLQCTTNYPSKIEDANILSMLAMKEACKVNVGYSCHVPNNYACYAAVSLGAQVIEKHFTLDKNMDGPDHSSSLSPEEFKELVHGIRCVEAAMGDGVKTPTTAEKNNTYGMKRSIVVLQDVDEGTVITEKMVGFKRPANGIPPKDLALVLGKKTRKALKKDDALTLDSIVW